MNGYFFLTTRTNGEYLSLWCNSFKLGYSDPRQKKRYLINWDRCHAIFVEYITLVVQSPHKKPLLYPVKDSFTQSLRKSMQRITVSDLREPEFLWVDMFKFNPSMVYPLDALFSAPLDMAMIPHKKDYTTTWNRLADGTILLDYEEYTAEWEGYL